MPESCEMCGCPARADLLDVNGIAQGLGVPVSTVRRWCRTGWLRATRHGRKWIVRHEDLDAWLLRDEGGVPDGTP